MRTLRTLDLFRSLVIALYLAGPAAAQSVIPVNEIDDALIVPSMQSAVSSGTSYFVLLRSDARRLALGPLEWDRSTWLKAGAAVAVVGGVMLADEKIRAEVRREDLDFLAKASLFVEPLGAEYSWGVLAGYYTVGRFTGNATAGAVARDGFAASLFSAGVVTPLLKELTGRTRPRDTEQEYQFQRGGRSFPSGHTTQAFAIASVIAAHSESRWVDAAAYGTAALVGYARMRHGAHYASDVTAGAIIGTVIGRSVVSMHSEGRNVEVSPYLSERGELGASIRFSF